MKKIEVKTPTVNSQILIGEKLDNLSNYLPEGKKVVIVTDENVNEHYADKFPQNVPVIVMGVGEKNKTIASLEDIFEKFIELEVDRSSFIVAIGGGIVCDAIGFAASVFMRGLRFGFVSTTLLSMVDASVGGKNGVNFKGFKNMIGVFNQPEFVICDVEMLQTLDREKYLSGFAEIVKAAAIMDEDLFTYIDNNAEKAVNLDFEVVSTLIHRSVQIKADVVEQDEREAGLRKILNFGHTFAHSFEKHNGISHGAAVSIGMVLASRLSVSKGLLEASAATKLEKLLEKLLLPVKIEVNNELIIDAMKKDKKRKGDFIALILIDKIGHAVIEDVPINKLEEIVNDLC